MLPVWYAIPTANAELCTRTFAKWREQGFKTAALVDSRYPDPPGNADMVIRVEEYEGHPRSVTALCRHILEKFPETDIICTGGDDIHPDTSHRAEEIHEQFMVHFPTTFGVMQPVGDFWMMDAAGLPAAARICGSPFMGREFIRRINGGTGPYWHEYFHFYADEEMKDVTERLGILWQRKDLSHYHDHWTRRRKRVRPTYLEDKRADWAKAKALFERRKAAGFPGHEPCEQH